MKLRDAFPTAALLALGGVVALGLAELGVRALERFEILEGSGQSAIFEDGPFQGTFRLSQNPRLVLELDPEDPSINDDGFRDRSFPVERGAATRIVALGDSVTFGWGVPTEDAWPKQLERLLAADDGPDPEVLNLGVGGYNTRQEVEFYEERGRKYDPDLIVVGFVLNDCFPPDWHPRPRPLAARPRPVFLLAGFPGLAFDHSRLLALLRDRLGGGDERGEAAIRRRVLGSCGKPDLWRIVTRGFARLESIAHWDGSHVLIVVIPMLIDTSRYPFTALHQSVVAEAKLRGHSVLDLLGAFSEHDARSLRLSSADTTHPNAAGHRLVAESIHAFLRESGLLERARAARGER